MKDAIERSGLKDLDLMREAEKLKRKLSLCWSDTFSIPTRTPLHRTSGYPFSPDQRIHTTSQAPSQASFLRPISILAAILALLFLYSRSLQHESEFPSRHDLPWFDEAQFFGTSLLDEGPSRSSGLINKARIRSSPTVYLTRILKTSRSK